MQHRLCLCLVEEYVVRAEQFGIWLILVSRAVASTSGDPFPSLRSVSAVATAAIHTCLAIIASTGLYTC